MCTHVQAVFKGSCRLSEGRGDYEDSDGLGTYQRTLKQIEIAWIEAYFKNIMDAPLFQVAQERLKSLAAGSQDGKDALKGFQSCVRTGWDDQKIKDVLSGKTKTVTGLGESQEIISLRLKVLEQDNKWQEAYNLALAAGLHSKVAVLGLKLGKFDDTLNQALSGAHSSEALQQLLVSVEEIRDTELQYKVLASLLLTDQQTGHNSFYMNRYPYTHYNYGQYSEKILTVAFSILRRPPLPDRSLARQSAPDYQDLMKQAVTLQKGTTSKTIVSKMPQRASAELLFEVALLLCIRNIELRSQSAVGLCDSVIRHDDPLAASSLLTYLTDKTIATRPQTEVPPSLTRYLLGKFTDQEEALKFYSRWKAQIPRDDVIGLCRRLLASNETHQRKAVEIGEGLFKTLNFSPNITPKAFVRDLASLFLEPAKKFGFTSLANMLASTAFQQSPTWELLVGLESTIPKGDWPALKAELLAKLKQQRLQSPHQYDHAALTKLFLMAGDLDFVIATLDPHKTTKEVLAIFERALDTHPDLAKNPAFSAYVVNLVRQERFGTGYTWHGMDPTALVEKLAQKEPVFVDTLLPLLVAKEIEYNNISVNQRHRTQIVAMLKLLKTAAEKGNVEYKWVEAFRKLMTGRLRRKGALIRHIKDHFPNVPLTGPIPGAPTA